MDNATRANLLERGTCPECFYGHQEHRIGCSLENERVGMDAEHTAHLERILTQFNADATAKYQAGQQEHGGNLWEKPGMLEHAIEEAIDLVVYLYTMKEQRDRRIVP